MSAVAVLSWLLITLLRIRCAGSRIRLPSRTGSLAAMYEAAMTPSFRDFLPPWVARQPWYAGPGVPRLRLLGTYRLQDPAGEVGLETHLVSDGVTGYQVPMTYRGAPLPGAEHRLIVTASHAVLGPRWIYDAEADPVWRAEVLRMVQTGGTSDPAASYRAEARGVRMTRAALSAAGIELVRVLEQGPPPPAPGLVLGSWVAPDGSAAEGCLVFVAAS